MVHLPFSWLVAGPFALTLPLPAGALFASGLLLGVGLGLALSRQGRRLRAVPPTFPARPIRMVDSDYFESLGRDMEIEQRL